jgi:hypothetical protein
MYNRKSPEGNIDSNRVVSNFKDSVYTCPELTMAAVRPGADDSLSLPSLQGNRRVYRDGRAEAAK